MTNLKQWVAAHPRLASWVALAIGMVVILIIAARDVGLLWNQWLFLILATVGVAGLCVWIIGWETDKDGDASSDASKDAARPKAEAGKE